MKCSQCGGKLQHAHRTFREHFLYLGIYRCRECGAATPVARRYRHHLGPHCRCPRCGTVRLARLKAPDPIDRKQGGLLNWVERLAGGGRRLHCCFCRLQFYDRRPLASELPLSSEQGLGTIRQ